MAVIGHWVVSFLCCYCVPEASVTLLCKMAMMSDMVAGLLVILSIETAGAFPWYVSTPPPATRQLIEKWQAHGQWLAGEDQSASQGFPGFAALLPIYLDITYSHSVEGMAILSMLVALVAVLAYRISFRYACVILVSAVSHPIMDMFFHDAYILAGNRAVTRVTVNFWQIPYMAPVAFLLECGLAYGGYRLWWSTRSPSSSENEIAHYERMFWSIALSHNMASFYVVSPALIWMMYKFFPSVQWLTPACYWGFVLFAVTMWSWALALYPLHKLQCLTKMKLEADLEQYEKIP